MDERNNNIELQPEQEQQEGVDLDIWRFRFRINGGPDMVGAVANAAVKVIPYVAGGYAVYKVVNNEAFQDCFKAIFKGIENCVLKKLEGGSLLITILVKGQLTADTILLMCEKGILLRRLNEQVENYGRKFKDLQPHFTSITFEDKEKATQEEWEYFMTNIEEKTLKVKDLQAVLVYNTLIEKGHYTEAEKLEQTGEFHPSLNYIARLLDKYKQRMNEKDWFAATQVQENLSKLLASKLVSSEEDLFTLASKLQKTNKFIEANLFYIIVAKMQNNKRAKKLQGLEILLKQQPTIKNQIFFNL